MTGVWSRNAGGLSCPRCCKRREAENLKAMKKVDWIGLEDLLTVEVKGWLVGGGRSIPWERKPSGGRLGAAEGFMPLSDQFSRITSAPLFEMTYSLLSLSNLPPLSGSGSNLTFSGKLSLSTAGPSFLAWGPLGALLTHQ